MINKLRTDHAKEYSSCLNFCYSLIPFDPSVTMQLLNVFFWIFLNNIFSSLSIKSKLSLQCMSKLNLFLHFLGTQSRNLQAAASNVILILMISLGLQESES